VQRLLAYTIRESVEAKIVVHGDGFDDPGTASGPRAAMPDV
jgi:hypothetical protein